MKTFGFQKKSYGAFGCLIGLAFGQRLSGLSVMVSFGPRPKGTMTKRILWMAT